MTVPRAIFHRFDSRALPMSVCLLLILPGTYLGHLFLNQLGYSTVLQIYTLLITVCVFGIVGLGYDILLGQLGYLSFGNALWFGAGAYGVQWLMAKVGLSLWIAMTGTLFATILISAVLGSVVTKSRGIAFAMITLALAEAFHLFVELDPLGISGGDEGLRLVMSGMPKSLIGIHNIGNVLLLAAVAFAIATAVYISISGSRVGLLWNAIRENEDRSVELGLPVGRQKIFAYIVSAVLTAIAGFVFLIFTRGISPHNVDAFVSLNFLIIVLLGGKGSWRGVFAGAMAYGVIMTIIPQYVGNFISSNPYLIIFSPLQDPQFLLGFTFILLMMTTGSGLAKERKRKSETRRVNVE